MPVVCLEAWPAIAAAVDTICLATVGATTWRQNRSLVKTASIESSASNFVVAETVRDRELRWEPLPSVQWIKRVVGSGGPDYES